MAEITPEKLKALQLGSIIEAGVLLKNITPEPLAYQLVNKSKSKPVFIFKVFFADIFLMNAKAEIKGDKIEWSQQA